MEKQYKNITHYKATGRPVALRGAEEDAIARNLLAH
jgi:hypothetical protein